MTVNKTPFFHTFIQDKRIEKDITLREFCRITRFDPSNWSKVERGIADPPKKKDVLDRIAKALNLTEEEKNELFDLAMLESIALELRPSEIIFRKLPLFLKTIRGEKLNERELRVLLKKISES